MHLANGVSGSDVKEVVLGCGNIGFVAVRDLRIAISARVGKRAAEVLRVNDCQVQECSKRGMPDCLGGHEIEGRWL